MIFFNPSRRKFFAVTALNFLFLLLLLTRVHAQTNDNLKFRLINSSNGLTSNIVTNIFQDNRGFLWIGTEDGLNMYDGSTITPLYLSDYIPAQRYSNFIEKIAEDTDHNILVAAKAGIIKYNWNTKQFSVAYKNAFAEYGNVYPDLFTDSKKNIWVCERVRIRKFDPHFHLLQSWNLHDTTDSKYLNGPNVTFFAGEDSVHDVWFTDRNEIFFIDQRTGKIDSATNDRLASIKSLKKISYFCISPHSVFAVADKHTFVHLNNNFKIISSFHLPEKIYPFYKDCIEENGSIWLDTDEDGILLMDEKKGSIQNLKPGKPGSNISSNNINNITKDATGNIFIATTAGVNEWCPGTSLFHEINLAEHTPGRYIIHRIFIKSNNIFASTSFGLIQSSITKNTADYFIDKSKNVYYAAAFPINDKWLISRHDKTEVLQIKNKQLVFSPFSIPHPGILDSTNAVSFYEDKNKNIWIGLGDDAGIVCWHTNNNSFDVYSQKNSGRHYCPLRHFRYAFEDGKGNIWMGYEKGGIAIFDVQQQRFVSSPAFEKDSLNNIAVSGMLNDGNKYFWIATNSGIIRYNKFTKTCRRITRADGLPSNSVNGIEADKEGNIWAGFEGALATINSKSNAITTYSAADGLPDEELQNPYYDSTTNTMFFCTDKNIIYFNPEQVKKIFPVLQPVITSFQVMGKEQPLSGTKKTELPYSKNYLSFSFSAPNFSNASENEYACKLEGADKSWNFLGNHHYAGYNQLQPGNYIFKIAARVKNGSWQYTAAPVVLTISTPFWRTVWFWILCITLLFCVIFSFVYLRLRNRFEKQMLAQSIRDKIAGDLHDDIGSTLSSISILSELAKQKSSAAIPFLNRIEENTSMMQETMSDIVWTINPKNDRFGNIIQRMSQFAAEMLEPKNIKLNFKADESLASLSLSMEKRKNFYLLFKEAINNCSKYSNATTTDISVSRKDGNIHLTIADNGKGFDASASFTGNGMMSMKKRAADLIGKFEIESSPGNGTVIRLHFKA